MIFEELVKVDILAPIQSALYERKLVLEADGTISQRREIDPNSPWVFKGHPEDRNSGLWLGVYFRYFRLIPRTCHSCFKVVLKPETLDDLFKVWKLQAKIDLAAKCGIEQRAFVRSKGYAAFWYCPIKDGLEGARSWFKKIKTKVKENGIKGDLFLKRGCSEMELAAGPSDKWVHSQEHERLEYMLDQVFVQPPDRTPQPAHHVIHVQRMWIERAWQIGDETVFKFADQYQFQPPTVRYEESDHKAEDFPIFLPKWMTEKKLFTFEGKNDPEPQGL